MEDQKRNAEESPAGWQRYQLLGALALCAVMGLEGALVAANRLGMIGGRTASGEVALSSTDPSHGQKEGGSQTHEKADASEEGAEKKARKPSATTDSDRDMYGVEVLNPIDEAFLPSSPRKRR